MIDGWARTCGYGTGRCRKQCKENEKKKGKCVVRMICCIPAVKHTSLEFAKKEETAYRFVASTAKACDKGILAVITMSQ